MRRSKQAPRFRRQRVDEHIMHALIDFANDVERHNQRDLAMKIIAREENYASSGVGQPDLRELPEKP
jgi:hypothetical protein